MLFSLFMYLMELSESEFLHVKKEQNLHVDFLSFPLQFTELVQLCFHDESDKIQYPPTFSSLLSC